MPLVTELTDADRTAWQGLWEGYLDFYGSTLSPEVTDGTFRRLVEPEGPIRGALVRDDAGTPVGLVHWLSHPATWSLGEYCYLEDLFVSPEARGGGYGRALIAHVTEWARERGCAKVYWLTRDTNTTARALYDRVATDTGFMQYSIPLG
ncbi:GNAT family N-acetyltransferase [Microbacterium sp. Root53]|jgi:GNAT superfamily N-acetyltransferase|uniref:GNAT family N-acetyltransferase n=1 Tax=Microbacterium sp. Root53 TaxID=1736553 RepID=UPI0006F84E6D|nr:GNAT family N-acetyltransferase [Microbacterium sp. Root53]KQZ04912.1 GNAT family acetyltransferase [Microbacterium sp. Root53]